MDALTARKMATMGLNATKPLLPPVHKLGIVYLKEPLTDAEEHLHTARLALKKLEEAQEDRNLDEEVVYRLKMRLYEAMEQLQEKEQGYFARRYISHSKPVVHGWQNRVTLMIQNFYKTSEHDARYVQQVSAEFHQDAVHSINLLHIMTTTIRDMNNLCYDAVTGARLKELPLPTLRREQEELVENLHDMHTLYRNIKQLPDNDPAKEKSLDEVEQRYHAAAIIVRIADNMIRNEWDLPSSHLPPM